LRGRGEEKKILLEKIHLRRKSKKEPSRKEDSKYFGGGGVILSKSLKRKVSREARCPAP